MLTRVEGTARHTRGRWAEMVQMCMHKQAFKALLQETGEL